MTTTISYNPSGVCSRKIDIEIEGDIIKNVEFEGGCNGNLKGISVLAQGRDIESVVNLLGGIKCGDKPSSCPAQLAEALTQYRSSK